MEDITENIINDVAFGQKVNDLVVTADIAVKILDIVKGGTVAAENVRVTERIHGDQNTKYSSNDIQQTLPALVKRGIKKISALFLENISSIKEAKEEPAGKVYINVKTNVKNVTIELDGVVIGSAPGKLLAPTGYHFIKATRDGYSSWERGVMISDGFELKISLEKK